MTGPVRTEDAPPGDAGPGPVTTPTLEVTPSREAQVGHLRVRRALPRRTRRTVGPWCFADHMGPVTVSAERGTDIGPHPHIGLQTVTWLLAGELLHTDSLGSEQVIRPGQLNLMTAGHGVAHAEESRGYAGEMQGVQLWVAQPERTRHGPPAFEHHADLPRVELDGGRGEATVLVGSLEGAGDAGRSPARHDTGQVGLDLALRPPAASGAGSGPGSRPGSATAVVPLRPAYEHALIVVEGAVAVGGTAVEPGHLAYLGEGRDELALEVRDRARLLLVGGEPFESPMLMWWNFVARTKDEVTAARDAWQAEDGERFAPVASRLERIPAPVTPWTPG
jgi:quercetin 2,3-dioxygenase